MKSITVKELVRGQHVILEVLGNKLELVVSGDAKPIHLKKGKAWDVMTQITTFGINRGNPIILRELEDYPECNPKLFVKTPELVAA